MAAVAILFQQEPVGVHEGALLTNSVCLVAKACAVCVSLSPLQLTCTYTGLMEGIMSIRSYIRASYVTITAAYCACNH